MMQWIRSLDRVLKGEATRPDELRRGTVDIPLGGLSLVILSGTKVAERWLEPVREVAPSAPIVFDAVDLQWLRHTGQPALTGFMKSEARPLKAPARPVWML